MQPGCSDDDDGSPNFRFRRGAFLGSSISTDRTRRQSIHERYCSIWLDVKIFNPCFETLDISRDIYDRSATDHQKPILQKKITRKNL